jgi:hypothetical protein
MKNLGLCLALALMAASASAQVQVQVKLEQEQFLPGEAIHVTVRVINHSGATLHFGKENWLMFSIEGRDGLIVLKNGETEIPHDFDLESSRVATVRVDLAPYFNISQTGSYSVTATLNIDQLNLETTSAPRRFDVIHGTKIWEQEFGLPQAAGAGRGDLEVRKYALQQANYLKHMKLYVRITDASDTRVVRVFPVGPMISFSRPQTQLDKESNLHLLYQDGSRSFNYSVITPDGELIIRQKHRYTDTPPRLKGDDAGNVIVVGGARQWADSDIPAQTTASAALENLHPPIKASNSSDDSTAPAH